MKQIMNQVSAIDKGMLRFEEESRAIAACRERYTREIVDKRRAADAAYATEMTRITGARSQVDSTYRQKVNELESSCRDLIRRHTEQITWIENALDEIPTKIKTKVLVGTQIQPANVGKATLQMAYDRLFDDSLQATMHRTFGKAAMMESFTADAVAYKLYLEAEIKNARSRMATDQNAANDKRNGIASLNDQQNRAQNRRNAELSSIDALQKKYDQDIADRRMRCDKEVQAFFATDTVTQYAGFVAKCVAGSGGSGTDWIDYRSDRPGTRYSIGDKMVPAKTGDTRLLQKFQGMHPKLFRGGHFCVPLLLEANESVQIFVDRGQAADASAYEFIQNVVLQRMRCASVGNIRVYLAEPDKSGRLPGPLSAKLSDNEAIGVFCINSKDAIRKTLAEIAADIDEINGLLGGCRNIYEYNKTHNPPIPERCIVLSEIAGVIEPEDWELVRVVWNNAARCGINMILLSSISIDRIPERYPHREPDVRFLQVPTAYIVTANDGRYSVRYGGGGFAFTPARLMAEQRKFADAYRNAVKKSRKVSALFADYFDAARPYPYKDATDEIALPVLVENRPGGKQTNFIMDSQSCAHTLLTGGTGAGKTTFLHLLIASIVMNYHPDDVELWLVDYGDVSFQRYIVNRPPHVRFAAMGKNEEFTYSFLEFVKAYFKKRADRFQACNVTQFEDYRRKNGPHSLPRVVLIIDEFHNMPQHTRQSLPHNTILENILREYRKLGLSCIFSDQTANTGLRDEALMQINNRLAMKQSHVKEIMETLSAVRDNFTPDMIRQMENTAQGELWYKMPGKGLSIENYKTIYADSRQIETVMQTSIRRNDTVQCDKKVYVIDGKERKTVKPGALGRLVAAARPEEFTFVMGSPTTIEPYFAFGVEQRYKHNILVAGYNRQIAADVLGELIVSALLKPNAAVIIFADPRDRTLPQLHMWLKALGADTRVKVYTDYAAMGKAIKKSYDKVKRRETFKKPTLLLWLGLPDLYEEFSVSDPYPPDADASPLAPSERVEITAEKQKQIHTDPELIRLAEQLGVTVEDMIASMTVTEEAQSEKAPPPKPAETPKIYNVNPFLLELFTLSSRFSLYHAVVLENASDIKKIKGLDLSCFIHKIGYAMSDTHSWDFGFGKSAAEIKSDEMALYRNEDTGAQSTFRPFIIKK